MSKSALSRPPSAHRSRSRALCAGVEYERRRGRRESAELLPWPSLLLRLRTRLSERAPVLSLSETTGARVQMVICFGYALSVLSLSLVYVRGAAAAAHCMG